MFLSFYITSIFSAPSLTLSVALISPENMTNSDYKGKRFRKIFFYKKVENIGQRRVWHGIWKLLEVEGRITNLRIKLLLTYSFRQSGAFLYIVEMMVEYKRFQQNLFFFG